MKKQILSEKQKKDLKYFFILTAIVYIAFGLLKLFNQYNFISFLCGEIFLTISYKLKKRIYKETDFINELIKENYELKEKLAVTEFSYNNCLTALSETDDSLKEYLNKQNNGSDKK